MTGNEAEIEDQDAIKRLEYAFAKRNLERQITYAAPDMLAALQKIVNNWGNLHHKDLMQARAAIQKAIG